jgi:hypothetical protein
VVTERVDADTQRPDLQVVGAADVDELDERVLEHGLLERVAQPLPDLEAEQLRVIAARLLMIGERLAVHRGRRHSHQAEQAVKCVGDLGVESVAQFSRESHGRGPYDSEQTERQES